MNLKLSKIAEITNGSLIGHDIIIKQISIDSRTLNSGDIYVAIKGQHFDGHDFVSLAQQAGASALIVEKQQINTELPQIIVKDSRLALAEIAGYWRTQFDIKVIGVTGSNGKTTVKEMIASILTMVGKTIFTKGNLNNDIGVPLTLFNLDESHRYMVVEMGANHIGEIAYSCRYAKPEVSIITNVGAAHLEGFGDLNGVAKTKAEIFGSLNANGVAIVNKDDFYFNYWREIIGDRKYISFGLHPESDISAQNISTQLTHTGFKTIFTLVTSTESLEINLNLAGIHNVKNALAAAAVANHFSIDLKLIKQGLEQIRPVVGRMQVLQGRKGNIIIDDSYNANPDSLKAALSALNPNSVNWLILGAFGELGSQSASIHKDIGSLIKSTSIQRLFTVGELTKNTVETFGAGGQYFENQEELISALNNAVTGKETLLIKGSRSQQMESIVSTMVDNFRAK